MAKTTKQEIIASARDLMRSRGYVATSMKNIADEVGLLKGSLYSHFPSKDELVPEVLRLTQDDMFSSMVLSGDWFSDYREALQRLVTMLLQNGRCIGMHLAYGIGDEAPALKQAICQFFLDIKTLLIEILSPGIDTDLAISLAEETILDLEGATLWLVLFKDEMPMIKAQERLLKKAQNYSAEVCEKVRTLLDKIHGDWRHASATEKQLAKRVLAAEEELLTARAALAGQIEAESCFR